MHHVAIKGPSSAGKSEIRKRVLSFIPPEDVISFSTVSEKALLYYEDDFPHKILSMGEAAGSDEKDMQDYLLRELMSEGKLRYIVAQRHGGTITIEKNGPVSFMVTTTKAALHPENETRMLSLEIDDSAEQTRRVLNRVALNIGTNADKDAIDFHPWHFFQQWLADGNRDVTIPYAEVLAKLIAARSVRLRRDFAQVLLAIKTHALLHRHHRDTDERGQIIADINRDYRHVAELIADTVSEASGVSIKKEVQETINAVKVETANLAPDDGATAFQISKLLKLDKASAWRRLKVAYAGGYVHNVETRRGQPGRWRVVPEQDVSEADGLLPSPELLASKFSPGHLGATRETAQPDGFSFADQMDNGCTDGCDGGCNPDPIASAEKPVANSKNGAQPQAQPRKPLNGKVKSPPVGGLRGLHGDEPVSDDLAQMSREIEDTINAAMADASRDKGRRR